MRALELGAPLVLALPLDGVPVAAEVAGLLHAPLDVYDPAAHPPVEGRDAVLVTDGMDTGIRAEAALQELRRRGPRRLVLAVPIAANQAIERVGDLADDVVCSERTDDLIAVGLWYEEFSETTEDDVRRLLARARAASGRH